MARGRVRAQFRLQRDQSFPDRTGFRAFLRESGQKPRHIRSRMALDILSNRIRRQVTAGIDDATEQQRAMDAFVKGFRAKWSARTRCRAPWVTTECRWSPTRG